MRKTKQMNLRCRFVCHKVDEKIVKVVHFSSRKQNTDQDLTESLPTEISVGRWKKNVVLNERGIRVGAWCNAAV